MSRTERTLLILATVLGLGGLTRVSLASLPLATGVVGGVALVLTLIGLLVNTRAHGADWNRGWVVLSAGLALDVSHALGRPAFGSSSSVADLVGATAGLATVVGLALLVEHRERGRAFEFALEGLIVALAVGFSAWIHLIPGEAGLGTLSAMAALAPAALDLVALWMVARLVSMSPGYPTAYRLLVASLAIMFAVDALDAGATLGATQAVGAGLGAVQFWGFVLWAAATAHPSLSQTFEPAPVAAPGTRLSFAQMALVGVALLVGPVTFAVRWLGDASTSGARILVGSTLISAVVVVYLVRLLQARAASEYRTQHDPLTGLPNRALFQHHVERALIQARDDASNVAVLSLDLDQFKTVNDSLGHDEGNRLLQEVARRLRSCLREQDTVARLGGDEFTLLVAGVDGTAGASALADTVLRQFDQPFDLGAVSLRTTTSIGIAVGPEHGQDPDLLLKNADTAMFRAKARGRGGSQVYTNEMSARARVKLSLESGLHGALERGELALHYQPQVDQRDGNVVGIEALVRWTHPKLGDVSPAAFVALAEETGLIIELGEWVLRTAAQQAQAWRLAGVLDVPIGVNVSARQFASQELHHTVARILEETGLPGDRLEIELTESIFHRDLGRTTETLQALRALGVRCSIDDFGTGYSGLSYLARLPIDRLKIDQSFVQHVDRGGDEASVVAAIIALAQSLRMDVIAEGVETVGQTRFLIDAGCRDAQGYRFSRPLPARELERRLSVASATGLVTVDNTAPELVPAEPLDPRVDRRRLGQVLAAVCQGGDDADSLDGVTLEVILAALETATRNSWVPGPVATRVAVGTLAGLLPVVGGAAAAGALPAPAQEVASSLLRSAGLTTASEPASEDGDDGHVVAVGEDDDVHGLVAALLAADRERLVGAPGEPDELVVVGVDHGGYEVLSSGMTAIRPGSGATIPDTDGRSPTDVATSDAGPAGERPAAVSALPAPPLPDLPDLIPALVERVSDLITAVGPAAEAGEETTADRGPVRDDRATGLSSGSSPGRPAEPGESPGHRADSTTPGRADGSPSDGRGSGGSGGSGGGHKGAGADS